MNLLLSILSISIVVYSAQACREGDCSPFCAGEIKDPTKKLTFYKKKDLELFNENFKGDEKFIELGEGKCNYKEDCKVAKKQEICAISEDGADGYPQTFRNFCDLNNHNAKNPDNEYVYYHDDSCNPLKSSMPSAEECDCLDCEDGKDPYEPVCSFPKDAKNAHPVSFSNQCWLKKFNCDLPRYEFMYWHEGTCYSDPRK